MQPPTKQHPLIEYPTVEEARKRAGQLMNRLFWDETAANEALTYWPTLKKGVLADESLQVAYQLVWHFDCDDGLEGTGIRQKEPFYADIQLELLKQCAGYLQQGLPLPQDLITCYTYYEPTKKWQPIYFKNKPLAYMKLMDIELWLRDIVMNWWRKLKHRKPRAV
jgi:hypothetical protein